MSKFNGQITVLRQLGDLGNPIKWCTDRLTIGSDESCDGCICSDSIDAKHCEIKLLPDMQAYIQHTGSKEFKTIVSGVEITEPLVLKHNTVFTVGKVSFKFEYPSSSPWFPNELAQKNFPDKPFTFIDRMGTHPVVSTPKKPSYMVHCHRTNSPTISPITLTKTKISTVVSNNRLNVRPFITPIQNKIIRKSNRKSKLNLNLIKSEEIRRHVSFGPNLSPEQFDKELPPIQPLKKGATPMKQYTDLSSSSEDQSSDLQPQTRRNSRLRYSIITNESFTNENYKRATDKNNSSFSFTKSQIDMNDSFRNQSKRNSRSSHRLQQSPLYYAKDSINRNSSGRKSINIYDYSSDNENLFPEESSLEESSMNSTTNSKKSKKSLSASTDESSKAKNKLRSMTSFSDMSLNDTNIGNSMLEDSINSISLDLGHIQQLACEQKDKMVQLMGKPVEKSTKLNKPGNSSILESDVESEKTENRKSDLFGIRKLFESNTGNEEAVESISAGSLKESRLVDNFKFPQSVPNKRSNRASSASKCGLVSLKRTSLRISSNQSPALENDQSYYGSEEVTKTRESNGSKTSLSLTNENKEIGISEVADSPKQITARKFLKSSRNVSTPPLEYKEITYFENLDTDHIEVNSVQTPNTRKSQKRFANGDDKSETEIDLIERVDSPQYLVKRTSRKGSLIPTSSNIHKEQNESITMNHFVTPNHSGIDQEFDNKDVSITENSDVGSLSRSMAAPIIRKSIASSNRQSSSANEEPNLFVELFKTPESSATRQSILTCNSVANSNESITENEGILPKGSKINERKSLKVPESRKSIEKRRSAPGRPITKNLMVSEQVLSSKETSLDKSPKIQKRKSVKTSVPRKSIISTKDLSFADDELENSIINNVDISENRQSINRPDSKKSIHSEKIEKAQVGLDTDSSENAENHKSLQGANSRNSATSKQSSFQKSENSDTVHTSSPKIMGNRKSMGMKRKSRTSEKETSSAEDTNTEALQIIDNTRQSTASNASRNSVVSRKEISFTNEELQNSGILQSTGTHVALVSPSARKSMMSINDINFESEHDSQEIFENRKSMKSDISRNSLISRKEKSFMNEDLKKSEILCENTPDISKSRYFSKSIGSRKSSLSPNELSFSIGESERSGMNLIESLTSHNETLFDDTEADSEEIIESAISMDNEILINSGTESKVSQQDISVKESDSTDLDNLEIVENRKSRRVSRKSKVSLKDISVKESDSAHLDNLEIVDNRKSRRVSRKSKVSHNEMSSTNEEVNDQSEDVMANEIVINSDTESKVSPKDISVKESDSADLDNLEIVENRKSRRVSRKSKVSQKDISVKESDSADLDNLEIAENRKSRRVSRKSKVSLKDISVKESDSADLDNLEMAENRKSRRVSRKSNVSHNEMSSTNEEVNDQSEDVMANEIVINSGTESKVSQKDISVKESDSADLDNLEIVENRKAQVSQKEIFSDNEEIDESEEPVKISEIKNIRKSTQSHTSKTLVDFKRGKSLVNKTGSEMANLESPLINRRLARKSLITKEEMYPADEIVDKFKILFKEQLVSRNNYSKSMTNLSNKKSIISRKKMSSAGDETGKIILADSPKINEHDKSIERMASKKSVISEKDNSYLAQLDETTQINEVHNLTRNSKAKMSLISQTEIFCENENIGVSDMDKSGSPSFINYRKSDKVFIPNNSTASVPQGTVLDKKESERSDLNGSEIVKNRKSMRSSITRRSQISTDIDYDISNEKRKSIQSSISFPADIPVESEGDSFLSKTASPVSGNDIENEMETVVPILSGRKMSQRHSITSDNRKLLESDVIEQTSRISDVSPKNPINIYDRVSSENNQQSIESSNETRKSIKVPSISLEKVEINNVTADIVTYIPKLIVRDFMESNNIIDQSNGKRRINKRDNKNLDEEPKAKRALRSNKIELIQDEGNVILSNTRTRRNLGTKKINISEPNGTSETNQENQSEVIVKSPIKTRQRRNKKLAPLIVQGNENHTIKITMQSNEEKDPELSVKSYLRTRQGNNKIVAVPSLVENNESDTIMPINNTNTSGTLQFNEDKKPEGVANSPRKTRKRKNNKVVVTESIEINLPLPLNTNNVQPMINEDTAFVATSVPQSIRTRSKKEILPTEIIKESRQPNTRRNKKANSDENINNDIPDLSIKRQRTNNKPRSKNDINIPENIEHIDLILNTNDDLNSVATSISKSTRSRFKKVLLAQSPVKEPRKLRGRKNNDNNENKNVPDQYVDGIDEDTDGAIIQTLRRVTTKSRKPIKDTENYLNSMDTENINDNITVESEDITKVMTTRATRSKLVKDIFKEPQVKTGLKRTRQLRKVSKPDNDIQSEAPSVTNDIPEVKKQKLTRFKRKVDLQNEQQSLVDNVASSNIRTTTRQLSKLKCNVGNETEMEQAKENISPKETVSETKTRQNKRHQTEEAKEVEKVVKQAKVTKKGVLIENVNVDNNNTNDNVTPILTRSRRGKL